LYAPTFRKNNALDIYNIEYEFLINELKYKFKGDWKLLIRLHPMISHLASKLYSFTRNIINATDYPDIQELLVATDFMITDYS
jgi:CDP-glycerol glycerophosphotransferase